MAGCGTSHLDQIQQLLVAPLAAIGKVKLFDSLAG